MQRALCVVKEKFRKKKKEPLFVSKWIEKRKMKKTALIFLKMDW